MHNLFGKTEENHQKPQSGQLFITEDNIVLLTGLINNTNVIPQRGMKYLIKFKYNLPIFITFIVNVIHFV